MEIKNKVFFHKLVLKCNFQISGLLLNSEPLSILKIQWHSSY